MFHVHPLFTPSVTERVRGAMENGPKIVVAASCQAFGIRTRVWIGKLIGNGAWFWVLTNDYSQVSLARWRRKKPYGAAPGNGVLDPCRKFHVSCVAPAIFQWAENGVQTDGGWKHPPQVGITEKPTAELAPWHLVAPSKKS